MNWAEKYRPKSLKEVIGNRKAKEKLLKWAEDWQRGKPSKKAVILYGRAGVGKTSSAHALAQDFNWKVIELNASDARGIDVIRNQVKTFARSKALGNVPFKIILLDESDALTKDAQHALRRIMEMFSSSCRFILSCNSSSKIIDPIQSRCVIFRFRPLDEKNFTKALERIINSEKLKIDRDVFPLLYELSNGDLRRAINLLQACSTKKRITKEIIEEVASSVQLNQTREILQLVLAKKFLEARNRLLEFMVKNGYSGLDIVKAIQKVIWDLKLDNKTKVKLIERCGEIEFRLVEGSDEFIQLEALLASFYDVMD